MRYFLRLLWGILVYFFCISPAQAQVLASGEDWSVPLWRLCAAIGILLLFIAGAVLFSRLRGGGLKIWQAGNVRRSRVLEVSRIDGQAVLCLAVFDGKEFLFVSHASGVEILEERAVDRSQECPQ